MKIIPVATTNGLTNRNNVAVAIYKATVSGDVLINHEALGSGFLVYGKDFQLMTAKHVVDGGINDNEILYIAYDTEEQDENEAWIWNGVQITELEPLDDIDIALGYLDMNHNKKLELPGLKIDTKVNRNARIVNIEYSSASSEIIYQSIRKGNIVYIHNSNIEDDTKGINIMETSFPCLRGASGSPVIDEQRQEYAIGIMIKNVDHELAPTQVIRALDDNGDLIEEIKYLMPQGLAISAYGIQKALADRVRDQEE